VQLALALPECEHLLLLAQLPAQEVGAGVDD